jgi:hypothetical protein
VKALIGSLQVQLQQAQQQMQQMGQELQSNRAELDVKVRKGDQDYDAKMAKIAADLRMHVEQLIAQRLGAQEQMQKEGFESGRDQFNRDKDREDAREAAEREARIV